MSGFIPVTQYSVTTRSGIASYSRKLVPIATIEEVEENRDGYCDILFRDKSKMTVLESMEFLLKNLNSPKVSYIISSDSEILPPKDNFNTREKKLPTWRSREVSKHISSHEEFKHGMKVSPNFATELAKEIGQNIEILQHDEFMIVAVIGVGMTENSSSYFMIWAIERRKNNEFHFYQAIRR